jgi:DegV family protein with EDD domain
MSRKVGIVVDSTFGLAKAYVEEKNITVVPLKVYIEEKEYVDGTIDPQVIVDALRDQKTLKTSQPSPEAFVKAYEEQLEAYEQVICLTLSSTLSGTFNSANLAKTIIENEHVYAVDSETTISGGIYLVERLVAFLETGKTAQEALTLLEELKNKGSIIFTVDNLQQLVKSGRLSRLQAIIGNALKIKPILRFRRGVLDVEHKARAFANVLKYLSGEAAKLLEQGKTIILINYVDVADKAKELQHEINQLSKDIVVRMAGVISPVVAAHIGLGGLGIYLTNE